MPADETRVLVIEDDPNTASLVALYLRREGFLAFTAGDGQAGLKMVERHRPQVVVLDLMLPRMDGWEVCRRLRRTSDLGIIMLTARDDEVDRIAGLTLGADDYLVKPFSPRELVARVKAVLRRTNAAARNPGRVLAHAGIRLDLAKRRLTVNDRPVALTAHEYHLLKALMSEPGRIFNRDELLSHLYPGAGATVVDRVIDVHIGKLRQKIEPDPAQPRYILTERGLGYRFADQGP